MINQKKRTYHFETSSLLLLRLVLTEAKKESPFRPLREQRDMNEELAIKLIASMQKKYRKAMSLRGAFVATKQSPLSQEIASLTAQRFARNDMKVEP